MGIIETKMCLYTRIIILLVIITISMELTNAIDLGFLKPSKPPNPLKPIGAGVYPSYKVSKAAAKFAKRDFDDPNIDFNTWNRWRETDRFLCRTDNDCNWMDENLECQQVEEFGWTVSADYRFNDQEPTGECGCKDGFVWDIEKRECKLTNLKLAIQYIVLIVIGICILIAIGCFILCCCIL